MELFDIHFGIEKLILIGLGALFIIEQIFYWFLGSYPYRIGILLKTVTISGPSTPIQNREIRRTDRLAIKKNGRKKETYVRYRYPLSILGPLVFVGQIKDNDNKLMIRIGPISAIFILALVAVAIIDSGFYGFLDILVLITLIVWLYLRFYNGIMRAFKCKS
jgi:hypothetical protein